MFNLRNFCTILLIANSLSFSQENDGLLRLHDKNPLMILHPIKKAITTRKYLLGNGSKLCVVYDPTAEQTGMSVSVKRASPIPLSDLELAQVSMATFLRSPRAHLKEMSLLDYCALANGFIENYIDVNSMGYRFICDDEMFPTLCKELTCFNIKSWNDTHVKNAISQAYPSELIQKNDYLEKAAFSSLFAKNHPAQIYSLRPKTVPNKKFIQEWIEEQYSSNELILFIVTSLPNEKLEPILLSTFGALNRSPKPFAATTPLAEISFSRLTFVPSRNNYRKMLLTWEINDQNPSYNYELAQFFSKQGNGSLHKSLRLSGLAHSVWAEWTPIQSFPSILTIHIELSSKGVRNWQEVVVQAKSLLYHHASNIQEIQSHLTEIRKLQCVAFSYPNKISPLNYLRKHTPGIVREPLETFPYASLLSGENAATLAQNYKNLLVKPIGIALCVPFHEWIEADDAVKKVQTVEHISSDGLSLVPTLRIKIPNISHQTLAFPELEYNCFVPDRISVSDTDLTTQNSNQFILQRNETPSLFAYSSENPCEQKETLVIVLQTLYHKLDLKLIQPEELIVRDLYNTCITRRLNAVNASAKAASCWFSITPSDHHLVITCTYWKDQAHEILAKLLHTLRVRNISSEEFNLCVEEQKQLYGIAFYPSLVDSALFVAKQNLVLGKFSPETTEKKIWELKHKAINELRLDSFVKKVFELQNQLALNAIYVGNKNFHELELLWTISRDFGLADQVLPTPKNSPWILKNIEKQHFSREDGHCFTIKIPFGKTQFAIDVASLWICNRLLENAILEHRTTIDLDNLKNAKVESFATGNMQFLMLSCSSTLANSKEMLEQYLCTLLQKFINDINDPNNTNSKKRFSKLKKMYQNEISGKNHKDSLVFKAESLLQEGLTHLHVVGKEKQNKFLLSFRHENFLKRINFFFQQLNTT